MGRWSHLTYPSLTQHQREYALGALLGDDNLTLRSVSRYAYLRSQQSLAHKAYLMWKFRVMQNHVLTPPRLIRNNRYERVHWAVYFATRTTPDLTALYQLCYPKNRKTVSRAWLNQLTAFSLAVWYMDDGTYAPGRNFCMLYTGAFPYEQQRVIQRYLNERWNMTECVIQRNRQQWCFRFTRRGTQQLLHIVEPHVMKIPSMRYKLSYPEQGWKAPVQTNMDPHTNAWKKAEEALLKARYGHMRAKVLAEQLGRTVNAVQLRARKLGLEGWPDRVSDGQGVYVVSAN